VAEIKGECPLCSSLTSITRRRHVGQNIETPAKRGANGGRSTRSRGSSRQAAAAGPDARGRRVGQPRDASPGGGPIQSGGRAIVVGDPSVSPPLRGGRPGRRPGPPDGAKISGHAHLGRPSTICLNPGIGSRYPASLESAGDAIRRRADKCMAAQPAANALWRAVPALHKSARTDRFHNQFVESSL
jgi:hypothetical protein